MNYGRQTPLCGQPFTVGPVGFVSASFIQSFIVTAVTVSILGGSTVLASASCCRACFVADERTHDCCKAVQHMM